jgi:acetyl/propionyl-CoA carboxylase alpha subunit
MRAVGNKERARELAQKVGVPVVPGAPDGKRLAKAAAEIGYPLLVKAADGGGGKGMRLVRAKEDFSDAVESARREAMAAFGSDRLVLEKYIDPARHIEIQILGDEHGGLWHFGERECSVQRRHQKVLEESPSPFVGPDLRARLGEAALRIARGAGYTNAGTAEFLVAADGSFHFLEVNARLQVEHPVTELAYGVDLVELQLRIASGERLSLDQAALVPRGHAIEARIYAEDPAREFLPSPGPVLLYREPSAPGLRVDSGIAEGYEIPDRYDPILLKMIAHADTRESARLALALALHETVLLGTITNLEYLAAIVEHPAFAAGDLDTRFLERRFDGWAPAPPEDEALALAAAVLETPESGSGDGAEDGERWSPWRTLGSWGRN